MDISDLKLSEYINKNISIKEKTNPYTFYILDDVFNPSVYQRIVDHFHVISQNTPLYSDTKNSTSKYKARITNISDKNISSGVDFFITDIWMNFISNFFKTKLKDYVALSYHHHDAPSEAGFVHSDYNICSFKTKKQSKVGLINSFYASDDDDEIKVMRHIAFIYYFNAGKEIPLSQHGRTNIFDQHHKAVDSSLFSANSMLLFEVTPETLHAYAGSNFERSAVVGWLHCSPAFAMKRNLEKVRKMYQSTSQVSERWNRKPNPWPISKDPEFLSVFKKQSSQIIKEFNLPPIPDKNKKQILILGGTQMLGRSFLELILSSKPENTIITIANRGVTNPNLFPNLNFIKIDRDHFNQCKALNNGVNYDLVVDFSCYNLNQIINTTKHLKYKKYIYISTISASDDNLKTEKNKEIRNYAKKKREVEDFVTNIENITYFRPPFVYGKYDYTGRTYQKNGKFYLNGSHYCVSEDNSGNFMHQKDLAKKIFRKYLENIL